MKMRKNLSVRESFCIWKIYLWGAGLADPEVGVPFGFDIEPTESLAGLEGVEVITRRVGIFVWTSSMRFGGCK